jgi:hypothetical protein
MPSMLLDPRAPLAGVAGATVYDYWRWAYSDLLSNTNRSVFAGQLVGAALGVVDRPRIQWDSVDLRYADHKIEVKASGDCQSWAQKDHRASASAFAWNTATGEYEGAPTRSADLYVFCHYPEREKERANVLDVPAWDFYVVPVQVLDRDLPRAKSLSLATVQRIAARCKFGGLRQMVDAALITTTAR